MKITWNSLTFTLLVKFLQNDKCAHHLIESFYGTQIGVGTSGFGRVLVLPHPNQTKIKHLYLNAKIPMVSSSNLCLSFNIKNVMWFEWKQVLISFIHMCFYRGTWLEGLAYGLTNIVIFEVWWSTCYCTIISLLPNITKINNIKPMNKWYLAYLFMWTIWGKEQHQAHVQAHIQRHVIIGKKATHVWWLWIR
jgi:hypothetical protein